MTFDAAPRERVLVVLDGFVIGVVVNGADGAVAAGDADARDCGWDTGCDSAPDGGVVTGGGCSGAGC